jgi:hypothetical protein
MASDLTPIPRFHVELGNVISVLPESAYPTNKTAALSKMKLRGKNDNENNEIKVQEHMIIIVN